MEKAKRLGLIQYKSKPTFQSGKSHGFVQGESLVEALILRGGLEFSY